MAQKKHPIEEKLKRHNRELAILNSIARSLNEKINLREALNTTLGKVAELLNLDTGWVWLLDEDSGDSYLAASQNLPPALTEDPERMKGSCYCLNTFREGDLKGAANVNFITCSRLKGLMKGTDGLRYHASIPLYAHGKKLGVMNVASRDWQELSRDDLQFLYTIGDFLSIAIERGKLFEKSMELVLMEERNRLAREIHDTLAQGLAAIAMQLETLDVRLETNTPNPEFRESIRHVLNLTRQNLDAARRSVWNLRAAPLEDRPLPEALPLLIEEYAANAHFQYQFEQSGEISPLPARIEMGLFRIAREALNNVAVHSGTSKVKLHLGFSAEEIQLTIEDNGKGFDLKKVPEDRFGLIGMNERATILGGKLTIESSPGKGTSIRVNIPLV